ncbi:class II aldolase/adducin family protein [Streptomyces sp. NPDC001100]
MSSEELRLRRELAAVYRLVAHLRMTDLIFTHISARLPGSEHHFLINPYGLLFEEVTASNLVKIDLSGHPVEESPPTRSTRPASSSAAPSTPPAPTPTASCTPTPGPAAP